MNLLMIIGIRRYRKMEIIFAKNAILSKGVYGKKRIKTKTWNTQNRNAKLTRGTTKMLQLTNQYDYNQCIRLSAQLDQISSALEGCAENTTDEFLDDNAYNDLIEMSYNIAKIASDVLQSASAHVVKRSE